MNVLKIKDIEIRYDTGENYNIYYVLNVIENNYELFSAFLGKIKIISLIQTNESNVFYINDFDQAFCKIVRSFLDNQDMKKIIENKEVLAAFYIETVFRNKFKDSVLYYNISNELLHSMIAYIYFKKTHCTFTDFINYLKEKKDLNKILDWLKKETLFDAYNFMLKSISDFLLQNDAEFSKNVDWVIRELTAQLCNNPFDFSDEKEVKLPPVTYQEIDTLFYEFLNYINAPQTWVQIYEDMKKNNRVIFERKIKNLDRSKCYRENDILKILISSDGTIRSFNSYVHEFIHYVSLQKGITFKQFLILELPSIFFETISLQFLKEKGYSQEAIENDIKHRNRNNLEINLSIFSLIKDISTFIKQGPISRKEKILALKSNLENLQKMKKTKEIHDNIDLDFMPLDEIDISKNIDENCENLINDYVQNGILIIGGYKYLLGTCLSEKILKKSIEDSTVISKMINIIDNFSNLQLKDILIEFNISYEDKPEDIISRKLAN